MSPLIKLIAVVGILLLLGATGWGYYNYTQSQKYQQELNLAKTDPTAQQKLAQEEVKRLVEEVGRVIELPKGEDPTVATVTDIEKLKDQPFFQRAKNGDKVLIYTNAKKAILYDPQAHKVIDVAPVNIGTSSAQQAQQARVVLRNGTATTGLTNKVEIDLKKSYPQLIVTLKDNAAKNDYSQTVVVYFDDQAKGAAENLAKTLNVSASNILPTGESKPQADILIIIGSDNPNAQSASPKP